MGRLRRNRALVLLAFGLVLFAAFVPAAAANLADVVLTPLWLLVPPVAVTRIVCKASKLNEQSASLLSLVASRAPPSRPTV